MEVDEVDKVFIGDISSSDSLEEVNTKGEFQVHKGCSIRYPAFLCGRKQSRELFHNGFLDSS